MSADEWNATPWHDQRAYLEGLEQDENVPFGFTGDGGFGEEGPAVRTGVDAGTSVIDLTAMRAELEAARGGKTGGG